MILTYEELKQWLWKSEYKHYIKMVNWQEEHYPNLIAELHVFKDNSIRITMRDSKTFAWCSEANLPRVSQNDT